MRFFIFKKITTFFWIKFTYAILSIFFLSAQEDNTVEDFYELSICAIFRNEALYLKEWIEFHKLQGVGHFYLYNNNSKDEYLSILDPYILSGEVTLINWPSNHSPALGEAHVWLQIQSRAYTDCIKKYGSSTKWLACIDIDEFLFCPTGQKLPAFLHQYEDYGGIGVNWLLFGTSNIWSLPPNTLMIENLTCCSPLETSRNRRYKSIIQPQYTLRAENAHKFRYKEGYFAISTNGDLLEAKIFSPTLSIDQIRINHYWTRTESHFINEKLESHKNRRVDSTLENLQERAKSYNDYVDTAILQFVPELRKQMGYEAW